jgi:Rrf2 family transcriptional regulator, iron-sulfur cluster assembly transcription factor
VLRLTTRTRYAIRALYDLAFHRRGQAAAAKEIAERQQIPLRFLEQILRDLRKAGIVDARRGPRGGYVLARAAPAVTLADVLRAVRGPIEDVFALDGQAPSRTGRRRGPRAAARDAAESDITALVWRDVTARLAAVLEGVTLQDFVTRAEAAGIKRAVRPPTMYFI